MMQISRIEELKEKSLRQKGIAFSEAEELLAVDWQVLPDLLRAAHHIRTYFLKNQVELCAITNAKSGACPEDCCFCGQSVHHQTKVAVYPLVGVEELVRRAEAAQAMRARRFCIVTSGRGVVQDEDMEVICEAIRQITTLGLLADASLGELTGVQVARLKEAGLSRYNHNIETAPSFFPSVCSTHTFTDRLQSIRLIKEAEIQLCCGGILDLGESPRQRLEMAFTLQSIDPDCIPINFLHPIRGTPVYKNTLSPPGELLKFLAILRFILPAKQIKVCGGREARLRSLQPLLFLSGADSFLIGDYLTTQGNPAAKDLEMIEDLGLVVVDR